MTRHAVAFAEIKALDSEQRLIEGWASRPSCDRQGDVVTSKGATYRLPLPLLIDHNHAAACGEVIEARASEDGVRFTAKIAKIAEPGAVKDLCDGAWQMVKNGLRKAVSIGFRPLEYEPLPSGGLKFTSWEWFELSLVAVPACAGATIDTIKSLDRELIRKAGRSRIVRLWDDPKPLGMTRPHRVVKLSEQGRSIAGIEPAGSLVKTLETLAADLDDEAQTAKDLKALGYPTTLALRSVGAVARETDAAIEALRARLAKLEARRG